MAVEDGGEAQASPDATDGPGRENHAVQGPDIVRPEHVRQKARDGAKAAPVREGQRPHDGAEAVVVKRADQVRQNGHHDDLNHEIEQEDELSRERRVGVERLDRHIGEHGEAQAAQAVEDAIDRHHVGALGS
ncbi:hypothetical protein Mapa_013191 [Marchantia paleacea]|nr:hypothetical protein Mapa_013191 [Marchantia paleacea]